MKRRQKKLENNILLLFFLPYRQVNGFKLTLKYNENLL